MISNIQLYNDFVILIANNTWMYCMVHDQETSLTGFYQMTVLLKEWYMPNFISTSSLVHGNIYSLNGSELHGKTIKCFDFLLSKFDAHKAASVVYECGCGVLTNHSPSSLAKTVNNPANSPRLWWQFICEIWPCKQHSIKRKLRNCFSLMLNKNPDIQPCTAENAVVCVKKLLQAILKFERPASRQRAKSNQKTGWFQKSQSSDKLGRSWVCCDYVWGITNNRKFEWPQTGVNVSKWPEYIGKCLNLVAKLNVFERREIQVHFRRDLANSQRNTMALHLSTPVQPFSYHKFQL